MAPETTRWDHNIARVSNIFLTADTENIRMEPSALAGMSGVHWISSSAHYLKRLHLEDKLHNATHIVWGTGGSMVPAAEMESYYLRGQELSGTGK